MHVQPPGAPVESEEAASNSRAGGRWERHDGVGRRREVRWDAWGQEAPGRSGRPPRVVQRSPDQTRTERSRADGSCRSRSLLAAELRPHSPADAVAGRRVDRLLILLEKNIWIWIWI